MSTEVRIEVGTRHSGYCSTKPTSARPFVRDAVHALGVRSQWDATRKALAIPAGAVDDVAAALEFAGYQVTVHRGAQLDRPGGGRR